MSTPSKRTFYRTVYTIEVLSEEPMNPDLDLADIDFAISEGECSGEVSMGPSEPIDAATVAKALAAQGSDAEFFNLNEDGSESSGSPYAEDAE